MKKIIPFVLLLVMVTTTYGQQNSPAPALSKQDYLQKSKHQKTAAWILVGSGTVIGTIGTIQILKEMAKVPFVWIPGQPEPDNSKANGGAVIASIGGAAILGSIPLFIASGKNKGRAAAVSFKNIPARTLQKNSFAYTSIPSVSVTIKL